MMHSIAICEAIKTVCGSGSGSD